MLKRGLFIIAWMLISINVHAQESTHTLFAVDIALSEQQKNTAFDVIREMTRNASESHSAGLTLFDDTIRRFSPLARLDTQQVQTLNQLLSESPASVSSTSNLAIGIERAIDDPVPATGASLVIFARGKIDTPTQDPRARFTEWLELILLPQASEKRIAITLVLPDELSADSAIENAFSHAPLHNIINLYSAQHAGHEVGEFLFVAL